MFVYKITNDKNNKVYIGQTIRPIAQRFERHINDALNNVLDTHFARAIRKYGRDSFSIEVIDTAINQDELNQKEQYWIRYYDSVQSGYNETDAIYKSGGNTYQSKSEEDMQLIKQKISASKLGGKNINAKQIKCKNIKTNEELFFDSLSECRDYFGETNHQFVSRRCMKKVRCLYKKEWMFAYLNDEYDDMMTTEPIKRTRCHIVVINLQTQEEKYFQTYASAERFYGFKHQTLNQTTHMKGESFVVNDIYKITILN